MLTGIQRCMFGLGEKNSMRAIASFVAKEATYAAGYKNRRQMLLFYWSWERANAPTEHHTYVHHEYLSASLTTLHVTKQNKRERWALLPDQTELPFRRFILHHLAHVLTCSSRYTNLWVYVSREVESNLKLTDIIFFALTVKKKAWGMPSFIIIENNISQPCLSPVVCPPKTHTHTHTAWGLSETLSTQKDSAEKKLGFQAKVGWGLYRKRTMWQGQHSSKRS